jgi:transposase InsO family protein
VIRQKKDKFPVMTMCRILKVSRSGFYKWIKNEPSRKLRLEAEKKLLNEIKDIHSKSRGVYGSPRIYAALSMAGKKAALNRVAKIMSKYNIIGVPRRRHKNTTSSRHNLFTSPNLLNQDFIIDMPDKVWVSDITYLRTYEGWCYLATVIDLFSRRVIGWALENNMKTELILKAFDMAKNRRGITPGLIFHSDMGSQYASDKFRNILSGLGVVQSMSRKGNCWDNAVAESFFSTIKREINGGPTWKSRHSLRMAVYEYIEIFYNRERLHSSNGYKSPVDYENCCAKKEHPAA